MSKIDLGYNYYLVKHNNEYYILFHDNYEILAITNAKYRLEDFICGCRGPIPNVTIDLDHGIPEKVYHKICMIASSIDTAEC